MAASTDAATRRKSREVVKIHDLLSDFVVSFLGRYFVGTACDKAPGKDAEASVVQWLDGKDHNGLALGKL
eukprot:Skav234630  [mRNA]  locus=scaffold171:266053:266384:- [translate_table: standard]